MEISLDGPFGAVLAKVYGHEQTITSKHHATIDIASLPFSQAELLFFVATFSMLAKLAAVDGEISSSEQSMIVRFAENGLKLNQSQKSFSIRVFEAAVQLEFEFSDFAQEFSNLYKTNNAMKLRMLETLVIVACVDANLCNRELPMLKQAAKVLGFENSKLEELINKHRQ